MRESAASEPATAVYILARTGDHEGGCDERWTDGRKVDSCPLCMTCAPRGGVSQVAIGGHTVFLSPVASRRSSCHSFLQNAYINTSQ